MRTRSCSVGLLMLTCAVFGCVKSHPQFVVPEMTTARQQYQLAYESYREAEGFVGKSDKRDEAFEKTEVAFQMVLDRFPDDTTFTPLADLMLGRCELMWNHFDKAAKRYREVVARYPDNAQVQQIGWFELGIALDQAKAYVEAKEAYRQFLERFGNDPSIKEDPEAQRRLSEARRRYRIIRSE